MLQPTRILAPETSILTLIEAKAHLRVDSVDEDTLITALIDAVTSYFDGFSGILGRALLPQTWRQLYSNFEYKMRLPVGPVQSVVSINYLDNSGVVLSISSDDFQLFTLASGSWVQPKFNKAWPNPAIGTLITIDYVAGNIIVPQAIKQAALLLLGHWFENRQSTTDVPKAVSILIAPFCRGLI